MAKSVQVLLRLVFSGHMIFIAVQFTVSKASVFELRSAYFHQLNSRKVFGTPEFFANDQSCLPLGRLLASWAKFCI